MRCYSRCCSDRCQDHIASAYLHLLCTSAQAGMAGKAPEHLQVGTCLQGRRHTWSVLDERCICQGGTRAECSSEPASSGLDRRSHTLFSPWLTGTFRRRSSYILHLPLGQRCRLGTYLVRRSLQGSRNLRGSRCTPPYPWHCSCPATCPRDRAPASRFQLCKSDQVHK